MKKTLLFVLSLLFTLTANYAQDSQSTPGENRNLRKCGTMEYLAQQKALDPMLELRLQQMEEFAQQWIKDHPEVSDDKVVITVPVVVHVVWKTAAQNISDARVQEQINVLNRDYAGLNTHSMGPFATSLKSNTELQFCLAKRTPAGLATNGIERRQTTVATFSMNDAMKFYSQGGLNQWDPNKYMNIWVCNIPSLCGYAVFPTSPLNNNYGVVIHYEYFGVTGAVPPYNLGGTTTHEIGHCFRLYHIWGDDGGACTGTDYCADTPNQADENYTCPAVGATVTDACSPSSPGVMYMNFMDYSDDACYTNFTPNQKARIQACFAGSGPLVSLKTSNGCTPVGIEETEAINNISIYPNPSNDALVNVKFVLANTGNIVITVSNILGDEIAKIGKQNVSSVDIPINLANKPAGIYFVKIQSGAQIITQKVSLIK